MARIGGSGPEEMRKLAIRIREADPKLRRAMRAKLRAAADPAVAAVQRSILDMPSVHGDGKLRADVARTVSSSVTTTRSTVRVDIVSRGSKMPAGQDTLPKHLDSRRGWAHPVYAQGARFTLGPSRARRYRHRPVDLRPVVHIGAWTWVRQHGKTQWFEEPIASRAREFQGAIQDAMDEVKREMGGL